MSVSWMVETIDGLLSMMTFARKWTKSDTCVRLRENVHKHAEALTMLITDQGRLRMASM